MTCENLDLTDFFNNFDLTDFFNKEVLEKMRFEEVTLEQFKTDYMIPKEGGYFLNIADYVTDKLIFCREDDKSSYEICTYISYFNNNNTYVITTEDTIHFNVVSGTLIIGYWKD